MRVTTSTELVSVRLSNSSSSRVLEAPGTGNNACETVCAGALMPTATRLGLCSTCRASSSTSLGNVAENSMFWRWAGSSLRMRFTSGRKPMSNMRSPSSSTRTSIASSLVARWETRSSRRPGQATTISTPERSALICGLAPTPP